MNSFPVPDMSEVTRLTRAGRLREAMALLKGSARSDATAAATADRVDPRTQALTGPALDKRRDDTAWKSTSRQPEASRPPARELFGRWSDKLSRLASLDPLGGGLGDSVAEPMLLPPGASFKELTFSNGATSRSYMLYVPSRHTGQPLPLVIMLHGCKQTPVDFAAGTGMNTLAEDEMFLVAYPGQPQSANASRCWNWFNPADQRRGGGEPALIAGITRQILADFGADPARVYVAGLSAGGAEAAIMAATYPDLYAAVGIHSGLACGAAVDLPSALAAMRGDGPVRARGSNRTVPTIVFHGDADHTVHPVNAERIVADTEAEPGLRRVVFTGKSAGGVGYTQVAHVDEAGRPMVERWVVHGAGHAWSGGHAAGSYTDPRGPDASRHMLRFFRHHQRRVG